jgi:hypothetical protein
LPKVLGALRVRRAPRIAAKNAMSEPGSSKGAESDKHIQMKKRRFLLLCNSR